MGLLFIFARLLLIRQPGNTHGIYRSGQIPPTERGDPTSHCFEHRDARPQPG
jgi:hypothetical protein